MLLPKLNGNSTISWIQLSLVSCGFLLNMAFLWITARTKQKRALIDFSIIVACAGKSVIGLEIFVRLLIPGKYQLPEVFKFLDTIDLLLDGVYIVSILILNVLRYRVIRNLHTPPNQESGSSQSKTFVRTGMVFVVMCSIAYSISVWFLDGQRNLIPMVAAFAAKTATKTIPWIMIVILNFVMLGKISIVLFKRRFTVHAAMQQFNRSGSIGGYALLKQFLYSLILQTVFYVCPSMFVYPLEFVPAIIKTSKPESNEIYWSMKVILVFLNPVMLCIILKSKYNVISAIRSSIMRIRSFDRQGRDRIRPLLQFPQQEESLQIMNESTVRKLMNNSPQNPKKLQIFTVIHPIITPPITPKSGCSLVSTDFKFPDIYSDAISINSSKWVTENGMTSPYHSKSLIAKGEATSPYSPKWFVDRLNTNTNLSLQSFESSVFSSASDLRPSLKTQSINGSNRERIGSLPANVQQVPVISYLEPPIQSRDRSKSLPRTVDIFKRC
ncbi:FSHR [Mytilus coruscus]|uniref:FSHR n=1 Tax=Mytilus coruscus TaxID=42192 RepID=A0A6J8DSB3_MYTCO|nr:FSHR [Mytilus coruscus]